MLTIRIIIKASQSLDIQVTIYSHNYSLDSDDKEELEQVVTVHILYNVGFIPLPSLTILP